MIDDKSGFNNNRIIALCLLFMCSVLLLPGTIASQTPAELQRAIRQMASSKATAVIMVEIQCKPGTADQWREAFEKDIVPAIREAIQKGDAFSNFSYLETPLPAQDIDFILLFELESFSALDTRRIPPHYEMLLRRLGPERFAALMKEMGNWEKTVRVSILRSYKVQ
jgi:hypothetical protein